MGKPSARCVPCQPHGLVWILVQPGRHGVGQCADGALRNRHLQLCQTSDIGDLPGDRKLAHQTGDSCLRRHAGPARCIANELPASLGTHLFFDGAPPYRVKRAGPFPDHGVLRPGMGRCSSGSRPTVRHVLAARLQPAQRLPLLCDGRECASPEKNAAANRTGPEPGLARRFPRTGGHQRRIFYSGGAGMALGAVAGECTHGLRAYAVDA